MRMASLHTPVPSNRSSASPMETQRFMTFSDVKRLRPAVLLLADFFAVSNLCNPLASPSPRLYIFNWKRCVVKFQLVAPPNYARWLNQRKLHPVSGSAWPSVSESILLQLFSRWENTCSCSSTQRVVHGILETCVIQCSGA